MAGRQHSSTGSRGHVLIVVQNLPVPLDRRVWLECQALRDRGYRVSVICPKGPGDPSYQELDAVRIHKYAPAPAASGVVGYAAEFAYSWLRTAVLALRVHRQDSIDVMQACNPPDTYWLLARLLRPLGVKFVFDQHDLCPELYQSRFNGSRSRLLERALLWLERMTYRTADRVVVDERVVPAIPPFAAVRMSEASSRWSGADPTRARCARSPEEELRKGRRAPLVVSRHHGASRWSRQAHPLGRHPRPQARRHRRSRAPFWVSAIANKRSAT